MKREKKNNNKLNKRNASHVMIICIEIYGATVKEIKWMDSLDIEF